MTRPLRPLLDAREGAAGALSVGIDVGGTFTDLVAVADDGRVSTRKVPSTPADQSQGVEDALSALGAPGAGVARVVHGTTVATNALLERRGARVVLCATRGLADLLELRRQERASLYDLSAHHPPPLVAAGDTVEVDERIAPEGVVRALDAAGARAAADAVAGRSPEVVAVALAHSYADASHERALLAALRERLPAGVDVVLSSDVLPEIREYERTATTAAEAYLRPTVSRYLRNLGERLRRAGYPAPSVMTSGGGMREADDAASSAASLALSGPAGGVVGAALALRAAGLADALTIDIGGTSADVGLVLGGAPMVEPGGIVAGAPIALPRVLVETVSAGGGSVAWIDEGGALQVGPRSAGVSPGPVAFGRGGAEPTATDAHIALGNVRADRFSGGVRLDAEAARAAVAALAARLGAAPERTARAIVAIADASMARTLRRLSVDRGVDPRRCALVAFGGGGPLHACGLADALGMQTVLVPPHAGVLSALGLATAPERRESLASVMRRAAELDAHALRAVARELSERAGTLARREWWARARFVGQGYELDVPFGDGDDGSAVAARFADLHRARFGFVLDRPVEVVSARHAAVGASREARLAREGASAWSGARMVDDGRGFEATVRGPASIALPDATLLVPEGWTARALEIGGWMVER